MKGISDGVTPATPLRASSGVSGRALLAKPMLFVLVYFTSRGLTERWFGSLVYSCRRYR